jgi:hypothetical protein
VFQMLRGELRPQLSRWKELNETQVPAFERMATGKQNP